MGGSVRRLRPTDTLAALVVVLLWGLNFIAGKIGLRELPPFLMLAVRFALVAMLLLPFLRRMPRQRLPLVLLLSMVLGVGHFGLMFAGLAGVDAGPAAIAIQLTIPFSAILAAVCFGERMGVLQIAGLGLAFVGVYLLAGEPARPLSVFHLLLVVGAAFAWAVANVVIKRLGRVDVFALNGWMALFVTPQLLLVSLLVESGQRQAVAAADWTAYAAVVYMAVCSSIIAYGLWYYLIERYPMNMVVPMTLLSPVLAVLLAVLLLDEPLNMATILGGVLTLSGVAIIEVLRPASVEAEPLP